MSFSSKSSEASKEKDQSKISSKVPVEFTPGIKFSKEQEERILSAAFAALQTDNSFVDLGAEVMYPKGEPTVPLTIEVPRVAVSGNALAADSRKDEKTEVKVNNKPSAPLHKASLMSGIRQRARKVEKAQRGSRRGDVYHIPISVGFDLTPSSGAYAQLQGASVMVGTTEWTALATLFDMVRCPRISYHYEPRGAFVFGSAFSAGVLHQPILLCGDDDAVTGLAFSTLGQRDMTDPRNHFANTQKRITGGFAIKRAFGTAATTPTTSKANISEWSDTGYFTNATGGLLVAVRTETLNAAEKFGYLTITFHTEWTTLL